MESHPIPWEFKFQVTFGFLKNIFSLSSVHGVPQVQLPTALYYTGQKKRKNG